MTEYITESGDMWDKISYKVFGDCKFAGEIMAANTAHLDTYKFRAGVRLNIPEISRETKIITPPWRTE